MFADLPLKPVNGVAMEIDLQPDAVTSRVYAPFVIPYAFHDQVKDQLDDVVAGGIIEQVSEPSDWCHPIMIMDKKILMRNV